MLLCIVKPNGPTNPVASRSAGEPYRFPAPASARSNQLDRRRPHDEPRDPAGDVLAVFAEVSRRINDLARDLKCLGYFDDDDSDRPRAA